MGREVTKQTTSYTVEQLVAVNPYNPDILPDLENYVNEQVSSQTYSLDANLCLLRLYQFEPERMSTQIVARILVKAEYARDILGILLKFDASVSRGCTWDTGVIHLPLKAL
ncbi:hypothetical protein GIB67_009664 [Kingdonia uniflora]|uniref:Uncharacterized protein n=1 Tax=Kingdonia uniflora TaxID=39325 RepID=A0A7J7LAY9_9MAGN|nr:hypothetical protein GIB67_009664 [Kingdonia uniflora]